MSITDKIIQRNMGIFGAGQFSQRKPGTAQSEHNHRTNGSDKNTTKMLVPKLNQFQATSNTLLQVGNDDPFADAESTAEIMSSLNKGQVSPELNCQDNNYVQQSLSPGSFTNNQQSKAIYKESGRIAAKEVHKEAIVNSAKSIEKQIYSEEKIHNNIQSVGKNIDDSDKALSPSSNKNENNKHDSKESIDASLAATSLRSQSSVIDSKNIMEHNATPVGQRRQNINQTVDPANKSHNRLRVSPKPDEGSRKSELDDSKNRNASSRKHTQNSVVLKPNSARISQTAINTKNKQKTNTNIHIGSIKVEVIDASSGTRNTKSTVPRKTKSTSVRKSSGRIGKSVSSFGLGQL